ncbi:P-loop containing nucleoside triphosphate hydrolase protein [Martensiomyces pterosporus]|nr:P-loop containing nucleoside triphosphate hydrolase protein [Martensiomyces pterosporus]
MAGIALLAAFARQASTQICLLEIASRSHSSLSRDEGRHRKAKRSSGADEPWHLSFSQLKLDPRIAEAADKLYGVSKPTDFQSRVLQQMMAPHNNVVIRQETGSGKTFAILLALLSLTLRDCHSLKKSGELNPASILEPLELNTLFVVPNRELAFQIEEWAGELLATAYPSLPRAKIIQRFVSGSPYEAQQTKVVKRHGLPSIAVGTPRCFVEMLTKETTPFKLQPPAVLRRFADADHTADHAEYMRLLQSIRLLKDREQVKPDDFRGLRRLVIDEVDNVLRLPGKHATDRQRELRKSKPRPGQVLVDTIYDMFGITRLHQATKEWASLPANSMAKKAKEAMEPKRQHPKGWDKKSDVALAKMRSGAADGAAGRQHVESKRSEAEIEGSPFNTVGRRSLQLTVASATANSDLRRWMQGHGWLLCRPAIIDTDSRRVEVPSNTTHYCLVIEDEQAIRNLRVKERGADGSAEDSRRATRQESREASADSVWETDVANRSDSDQRTVMELMAEVASNVIAELKPSGSVIIFTRSDASASQFGHVLESFGVHARDIMTRFDADIRRQLDEDQEQREGGLGFVPGKTAEVEPGDKRPNVYIATEDAARGIDVRDTGLVLILDIPKSTSSYAHLSGRAGRFGRHGTVVTVVPVGRLGWYESKMRGIFSTLNIKPQKAPFKAQAREKAQKEAAKKKSAVSQYKARADAIQFNCPVCKAPNANYKNFVNHWEHKHDGSPVPPESQFQK